MRLFSGVGGLALIVFTTAPSLGQAFPTEDAVIRRIWDEGMNRSQAMTLMQTLTDSIGPRLTGTPGIKAGNDLLVATYRGWGATARNEQYGTWLGWRRGVTHLDLIKPRVRSLEATMLAWSPGTKGKPVEGGPIILPEVADSAFQAWLPNVKGKLVLISQPMPTCRPDSSFRQFAQPATFESLQRDRRAAAEAWTRRLQRTGLSNRDLPRTLERAGAVGVLTSLWSQGWGVTKIFQARTQDVPTLDLSCEDYGLVYRLTERNQGPVLRLFADAEFQGEVPVFNTIAEIKGTEKPDEYGSRAFVQDHPEVVAGLQALFNQDNGTGRVVNMSASGLVGAGAPLAAWLSRVPTEITRHINLSVPGGPAGGGSDHASFVCSGAPGFGLGALGWEYGTYTWHTNRDTYDKVVADELKNNAVLTAMLAYLAAEDPNRVPRDRRIVAPSPSGQQGTWPACVAPARSIGQSSR